MIYCVEDENSIRELMIYTLNASGFEARGFTDGAALFDAMKTKLPELILLDIMLPGEDGITILKRLKSSTKIADIPVIMATAKGTEFDKVTGLDEGADDYLAKPFGMMEMVSRVKAVLRRTKRVEKSSVLKIGNLILNAAEHSVFADGTEVKLTLKEFEILKLFMENPGLVFTREHLLQSVWGADFLGETRTVDVHIGTLRTKLGGCGDCIETVRGVGYRMGAKL
ncbi:MAG: response regulator transcription factor [Bacteroides sp.]|nr:response regulator transcription factor [Eubacterium sp.]MCM1417622.1 response regulator transcription factor [Roseburia sp.]MCM1461666.1 response regulator transcription factor [Bacteroides sp.]